MNTTDTVDRLEREVSQTRSSLRENVGELQTRARHLTDWRAQVNEHPMAMMGLALGGGLLAASMIGGHSHEDRQLHGRAARRKYSGRHDRRNHVVVDRRGPRLTNGHADASSRHTDGSGLWRGIGAAAATAAPLMKRMATKRKRSGSSWLSRASAR